MSPFALQDEEVTIIMQTIEDTVSLFKVNLVTIAMKGPKCHVACPSGPKKQEHLAWLGQPLLYRTQMEGR